MKSKLLTYFCAACLLVAGGGGLYAKVGAPKHPKTPDPGKVLREDGVTLKAWVQTTKDGKGVELNVRVSKDGKTMASFTRFLVNYDPNLEKDVQMARKDHMLKGYRYDDDAHEIIVDVSMPASHTGAKHETLRFPYELP